MPTIRPDTRWNELHAGLRSKPQLIQEAVTDPRRLSELMERHRYATTCFLDYFLLKHKVVLDDVDRKRAAEQIWRGVRQVLPGKLQTVWTRGGTPFRSLLYSVVCETIHVWQKLSEYRPAIAGLASPMPGDEAEALRMERDAALNYAREQLRLKSLAERNCQYEVYVMWEGDMEVDQRCLAARMAKLGQPMSYDSFRQELHKAREAFGRFLNDHISEAFGEPDPLSRSKLRKAYEELDLMDDYAMHSAYCRDVLGVPK